jgi:GntR family L-lactate dehydrogenase operon transcriptional regulator
VKDLDREILRIIALQTRPVGQGTINQILRETGFSISTPTVGRKLQELEFQGLLEKKSVDGRLITVEGKRVLRDWDAEAKLRGSGEALLDTLKRKDRRHLLELLDARRIIESETASLAAKHASASAIRTMDDLLEQQQAQISKGGLAIEEDVLFHEEIARASRNAVLQSFVTLLRQNRRYNYIITSMRKVVGTRLVVDHRAILDAIRTHDSERARNAMADHIQKLAQDLNRSWGDKSAVDGEVSSETS